MPGERRREPGRFVYRPAGEADLAACEEIWRDAINDYTAPLGQHEIPPDNPSLRSLHAHTLATDPSRFWVAAVGPGPGAPPAGRVVGFVSAVRRERVWFLSMLFVRPGIQASGLGRGLLARVLPAADDDAILATATDAAQPISNGLYAQYGIVPRVPLFNLVGRPTRPDALPSLPGAVRASRFGEPGGRDDGPAFEAELASIDREVLGFAHPEDHAYLRRTGRIGFAYRDPQGALLGYGYTSEVGRVGPIAVRDPDLNAPVAGDLLRAVTPRGASAIWVPGHAGPATEALLRAGLRIEGFPVLLCWSRPFADLTRYLPSSPGLL